MDRMIELLIDALPLEDLKKQIFKWAKEQVENTDSPIDDHFVKVLCKLMDLDYEDL